MQSCRIFALSLGNIIQFSFHFRRERVADVFRKMVFQKELTTSPGVGGEERAAFFCHISAVLNGLDDRRIGGRASDSAFFQFFHKPRFCVTRRRLCGAFFRS